ncbi:hypothetical protein V7S57_02490 [Caulobacter sp. CCNWLY153]|uniref:hypothetical protein n=1 Tax=unclassified Caulobacter TaxID=2648921 RepID=UPI002FF2BCB5
MVDIPADFPAMVTALNQAVADWRTSVTQFRTLMTGSATGGPGGDGYYPVTLDDGSTVNMPCLARINAETQVGQAICMAVVGDYEVLSYGASQAFARSHVAFDLLAVRASLSAASTAGQVVIDIRKNGVSILSTKITILPGFRSSLQGGATQPVIIDTAIAVDDELTVDVLTEGTAAKGLKVMAVGVNAL